MRDNNKSAIKIRYSISPWIKPCQKSVKTMKTKRMKTKDNLEPLCSHELMYILFHSSLGRTVKGHSLQDKTTRQPERNYRPLLNGMSSLGIIAHLPWDRWRFKERNLLCCHFSIIHINTWEQSYELQRMKGNKNHVYLTLECICTYICLEGVYIP